ncbi:protein tincar isoform X2 [Euwallacea similis]|uniref:protein tincar isoform X2 n=1 Tax=Euwallacea similis TaxID=1736056 RepID=UPI003450FA61
MSSTTKGNYHAIKSSENEWPPNHQYNKKDGVHLNNLWSIWYGIICAILQGYLAYKCLKEILGYSVLTWPDGLPYLELNCSLGLNGAVFLLLPIFFTVTILKIGNLANDGYKLGRQTSMCSREPTDVLGSGANCGLFRYGGPTAAFIHIAMAFCLLIPKVLMEGKMIQAGFLSQDFIWHTDLDFLLSQKNRSMVLSFNPLSGNGSGANAMVLNEMAQRFYDPSKLIRFSSANLTHTVIKTLKDFIGHETRKYEAVAADGLWHSSISLEYINLITALVIYSVRYPSLFWSANKCLGLLFSFMLIVNGMQIVLSFAGISILYKLHIADIWNYLPFNQPRLYMTLSPSGLSPFLLNAQVTFALYMLATLLVLASSVVMYFYGHTRFMEFINHQRDKKLITLPGSYSNIWVYFTHCAAFCTIISIGICNAPLVHDFVVAYKGNHDEVQLICIVYDVFHLLFWSFAWMFLSAKHRWTFKIRISIGEAVIKESRSLRLIHSVHLNNQQQRTEEASTQQPLLIIGNGRTYTVADTLPKKAIMEVLQRSAIVKKSKSNGSMAASEDMSEEIYWLRPTLDGSSQAQKRSKYLRWFRRKSRQSFVETSNTSPKRAKPNARNSVIPGIDEDDGDYATLRELPLAPQRTNVSIDNSGSEGKLLAAVHDEEITYASANKDFTPPSLYQEHNNSLLEPIVVHTDFASQQPSTSGNSERLLRADSGILAHEELPGRSNSLSTECSVSPPEPPGSSHSESSSGVHSNDSNETSIAKQQPSKPSSDWKSSQNDVNSNGELNPESTVVIRRKSIRPNPNEGVAEAILKEDPYGRATNMRMTSFMDSKGILSQSSSATLPHYPTQPSVQNVFSNCSTMPLPQHTSASIPQPMVNGNSCNVYTNRLHTTIPTHLNGVKLVTTTSAGTRVAEATPHISKLEPIYTKINRATNELCHYSSSRRS